MLRQFLRLSLLSTLIACWLASANADLPTNGPIEAEFPASEFVPYTERRPLGQLTFGLIYEPIKFPGLISSLDSTSSYDQLFRSTLPLLSLSAGYKINLPIIAIDLSYLYGQGVLSDDKSGASVALSISKKGFRAIIEIDHIFSESYVVPYAGIQAITWDYAIRTTASSSSGVSARVLGLQAGVYLGLSRLEEQSALRSYNDGRLNNTYLDLSITQYPKTEPTSSVPNLATGTNFALGFRLEF